MGAATRACGGCNRAINGALVVCPFCGHRAGSTDLVGPPPAFRVAAPMPASSEAAVDSSTTSERCPRCGSLAGHHPVRVEVWKSGSHWNPGVRLFNVLSKDLPGLCSSCNSWLRGQRRAASALMVAPFLVLAAAAGTGKLPALMLAGMYGLYLVRGATYGFADSMLYGDELGTTFRDRIPHHPDGAPDTESARFPAGIGHALARLGAASVFGFVLAFAANVISNTAVGQDEDDTLSLLSRPSKAYVASASTRAPLPTSTTDGQRVVTAYTSLEALPAGAGLQISPHDLFERAIDDESIEALVFDPGPMSLTVPRKRFKYFKLRLPLWPTKAEVVNHVPATPTSGR